MSGIKLLNSYLNFKNPLTRDFLPQMRINEMYHTNSVDKMKISNLG